MVREQLQLNQPVVYKTLRNAIKNDRLSHCYLFSGQKSAMTKEAAVLLAQSIICENRQDHLACECCNSCRRIAEGNYADIIYLDGSNASIKNDDVYSIQQQFYRTALEAAGKKIFIINDCENMTGKASNSLLKFIEEPTNNTYGIFITSNLARVLPTIISRCQVVNFKPLDRSAYYRKAEEAGYDPLSAHLLSQLVRNESEIRELAESRSYQNAVKIFTDFMNYLFANERQAMVYLQENGFRDSSRTQDKNCFSYFLEIACIFVNDYHLNTELDDETWMALLRKARENNFRSETYLLTVSETKDQLVTGANVPLLIDQMLYKMIGGAK